MDHSEYNSACFTLVTDQDSGRTTVSLTTTIQCEKHGEHKQRESFGFDVDTSVGNYADWLKDCLVQLVERF
uniref:Uncharacterized protein n=1 Tax=uncultured prokaryote TaxID=198431 RepID=A0A0H5Q559_9ZZZZ|nr:hypothetical protein [uncultured prokaryote]